MHIHKPVQECFMVFIINVLPLLDKIINQARMRERMKVRSEVRFMNLCINKTYYHAIL